ncbi:MAG TPA: hypothetical protein ENN84_10450 [Candidatus Marinimicrobia bacterium]|nr:hypothetical protein [Candidatus Neomarinimicrobiota bacterium]
MTLWLDDEIKRLLIGLLDGALTRRGFKRFYDYCYHIAYAYLLSKKESGKLYFQIQSKSSLDLQDLAIDCIAKLFEQDKDNAFPRFSNWFRKQFFDPATQADSQLFLSLKALVLSHVQQELQVYFRNVDPEG